MMVALKDESLVVAITRALVIITRALSKHGFLILSQMGGGGGGRRVVEPIHDGPPQRQDRGCGCAGSAG
jgi:transcriptional regulator CtsR